MDLTHLRYLQAIAQSGTLTRAAQKVHISQPALSVAIRNLEERFKTTLLLRDRHGVTLTTSGQEMLRCADEIFGLIERTEQRIRGLEAEETGDFIIGCHESLGAYFLPRFMHAFLQQAPRIEISLWNGTSMEVRQAVVDRQIHFGLVVNPLPHPDLVMVELFKDAVDIFIAPSRAPATEDLAAAGEILRKGPLIHAGRVTQCQDLIARLAAESMLPLRMLSCGDLELVKSLTLEGLGVGLLPRRVAAYGHPGELRRLHPSLPFIPDTIQLLYRTDMHRTRAALTLKKALVDHGKSLGEA